MESPDPGAPLIFAVLPDAVLKYPKDPFYLHQIPEQLEPPEPGGSHRPAAGPDVHSHSHPGSGVSPSWVPAPVLNVESAEFLALLWRLWRTIRERVAVGRLLSRAQFPRVRETGLLCSYFPYTWF